MNGTAIGSAGAAPLLIWLWNVYMPDTQITPEAAATAAVLLAAVTKYIIGWLPTPPRYKETQE